MYENIIFTHHTYEQQLPIQREALKMMVKSRIGE
jgi:hypothetical protein